MPRTLPAHPTAEQLRAFGLGQLSPSESAEVERHVESCDDCCRVLQAVPDDTVLVKLKQSHTLSEASAAAESKPMLDRPSDNGAIPAALRDHPRYRVLKVLGRGGMGTVYKAEHRLMERPVALKVISRRLIANRSAVERFQREVKLAARLTHPNIVVAHDAEQAGDLHFLVMEFVDGISLAQFVERKGPLPVPLASLFIRQAALGLQAASQHGMVHRDIKPQNLMLTRKGQIKILDFGLARFASEGPQESVAGESLLDRLDGLTSAGTILGTPDYMAPEQAEDSSQADIRADIYSLGCTLFFLLTGEAPFAGDSVTRTLQSHIDREPPSLRSLRPDLSAEFVRIVERMMAKDPAERFQTPADVAKALSKFATGGLASMQQWEAITVHRPTPSFEAETDIEEPPTTVELVRRRHWKTLWNRARYELRKFFRLPHRRFAAGAITVLLVIATTAFLADHFGPQLTATSSNQTPSREDNGALAGTIVAPSRPLSDKSGASSAMSPAPSAVASSEFSKRESPNPKTSNVAPAALLRHPRVALVLTSRLFWNLDYRKLREVLERRNVLITVVSTKVGWVSADPTNKWTNEKPPADVFSELTIGEVRPSDFDAVVFVPANYAEYLDGSDDKSIEPTTRRVLKDLIDAKVVVGTVGNAGAVLAFHGLLHGLKATGNEGFLRKDQFQDAADWDFSQEVIASGPGGRLITARSVGSIDLFAERLLETVYRRIAESSRRGM